MRTPVVVRLMPLLLATTLVALACEQPPNPAAPQPPSFAASDGKTDRITGGGKLGDGRDFATFGFNARDGQGQFQWVQHCLDGVNPDPPFTCSLGSFTFHASTVMGYAPTDPDLDHCRGWSGDDGEAKFKDLGTAITGIAFSVRACDFGEPGRGKDSICFMFTAYSRGDFLAGGNIQLHPGAPEGTVTSCEAGTV